MRKTFLAIILALFCTEVSGDWIWPAFRDVQQAYQSKEMIKTDDSICGLNRRVDCRWLHWLSDVCKKQIANNFEMPFIDCRNFYNL